MKYLVFIETSDIGVDYCAQAAHRMGFTPLFLVKLSQYSGDTRAQILKHAHRDLDTTDLKAVRAALNALSPNLGAVTSLLDNHIATAIEMSVLFNCPGPDSALLRLKDKMAVVNLIPEFSPRTMLTSLADKKENDLREFIKATGALVMKLNRGTGALGMEIVRCQDELQAVLARKRSEQVPHYLESDPWIMQELIEGELASCEGYVVNCQIHFIGFTGRKKVLNTESQAIFPYDKILSLTSKKMAEEALRALIARGEVKRGYFHTEFIFTSERCYLIDANLGRVGGGPVGEMLALSYGVEAIDIYQHFLEITLFGKSDLMPYQDKVPQTSKSLLYGSPVDFFLKKLELPVQLVSRHMRLLSDECHVPAMGANNWAWIGILTGISPVVDREFEQIQLVGNTGTAKPIC